MDRRCWLRRSGDSLAEATKFLIVPSCPEFQCGELSRVPMRRERSSIGKCRSRVMIVAQHGGSSVPARVSLYDVTGTIAHGALVKSARREHIVQGE